MSKIGVSIPNKRRFLKKNNLCVSNVKPISIHLISISNLHRASKTPFSFTTRVFFRNMRSPFDSFSDHHLLFRLNLSTPAAFCKYRKLWSHWVLYRVIFVLNYLRVVRDRRPEDWLAERKGREPLVKKLSSFCDNIFAAVTFIINHVLLSKKLQLKSFHIH